VGVETPRLADNAFFASLGVPEDALPDVYEWDGWTAAIVRQGLKRIADAASIEPEKLLVCALHRRQEAQTEGRATVRVLQKKVGDLRRRIRVRDVRLRQRRMVPHGEALEKILRCEAHLSRQMLQALHELQRLQAARAGQPAPLPAALDVTMEVGTNTPAPLKTIQEDLLKKASGEPQVLDPQGDGTRPVLVTERRVFAEQSQCQEATGCADEPA
jgi:hypothetical protein